MGAAAGQRWWQGILARSLFAVAGIALLFGTLVSLRVSQTVAEREHDQAVVGLSELLDTVESTASIACFANDEQLASEVAQGLLRNGDVGRVVIRAGERELARAEHPAAGQTRRAPAKVGAGETVTAGWQVVRHLRSPFKHDEVVGDIVLDADAPAIAERIEQNALDAVLYLSGQLALVVVAVAAMMFFFVVRPIKTISDRLHHLDPTSGKRLKVPEGHENTEVGRLVGDINDLTGRLVATLEQERELQRRQTVAQRKYQDLFDNAGSGIFVADRDGWLESYNRAFAALTWLPGAATRARLTDSAWGEPESLLTLLASSIEAASDATAAWEGDYLLNGRRGDERWLHVAVVPLGDGNVQGTVTDVTQRKREELSARRLAVTDPLTGFANRAGLQNVLAGLLPTDPPFALVMIDLDGFKQVNEAMGLPVGDQLLLAVAGRLRDFLQAGDLAARIGGDEFVLVLAGAHQRAAIDARMDRLLETLAPSYPLSMADSQGEISIRASIGIALFPADGLDLHGLLRSSELALNSVQAAGGRTYRYFDPAQQAAVEHRRRLEDDLRHSFGAGELHLTFQPIIDIGSGRLAGAEALLRWTHSQRGPVSPDVFIPLAEEIDLIGEIGRMVLEESCRCVAEWRRYGLDIYVSVNVSVKQIPDELPPAVLQQALARHALPPDAIVIEITEGVLMTNVGVAQGWIDSLRAAGLRIYLDDFGTGYSSLSYLKRFPMDTVKIDKTFVRDMGNDNSDRALVEAIVTMAGSLGLKVVAEGVEDARQLALLRELGWATGRATTSRGRSGERISCPSPRASASAWRVPVLSVKEFEESAL